MMAMLMTAVVGWNDRVSECRQGIGFLPLCSHLWSLLQSHVILEKGPPTCETWGGCARLGPCYLSCSVPTGAGAPWGAWALWDTRYPHTAALCNPTVSPKTCCWPLFPQPRASAEHAGLYPTPFCSLAGLHAGQQRVQRPACCGGVTGGDCRCLQLPLNIQWQEAVLPCPWGIAPLAPAAEGLLLSFREWWPGFPHPSAWVSCPGTPLSHYQGAGGPCSCPSGSRTLS